MRMRMRMRMWMLLVVVLMMVMVVGVESNSRRRRWGEEEEEEEEEEKKSIYEVLRSHGLPMGVLPKGVREFKVDGEGRFEAHLDRPCTAKFENEVKYDKNITGTLSYGQIGALSGISAQELFLWFPVKGIRVDIPSSGLIYFDVGVIYKQLPLSLFETPPDCHVSSSLSESGELLFEINQKVPQRAVV